MNEQSLAIGREAGLAAEHLGIGVTALGKANYAQHAYYGQAFFALSIGFERAAKLAVVVDHCIEHEGAFPTPDVVRAFGHDLKALLGQTDAIAGRRGLSESLGRLPQSKIHEGIIEVLSDFASNITRYYNIDIITGKPGVTKKDDPVALWFEKVIRPVLSIHYGPRQQAKHRYNARAISNLIGGFTLVAHTSELGDSIDNVFDASVQTGITSFAKPYTRMYVLQIVRFVTRLLSELGYIAMDKRVEAIPHLSEYFAIFNNPDSYFRKRRTWSIYRP